MVINVVIVEDEPPAQEKLKNFVQKVPFLKLLACVESALDAVVLLKENRVDLLFVDIQMDGVTGIQLLESLTKRPEVIITTAYHEYALKGYELSIVDYLLKPYSFDRFLQAVNKATDKLAAPRQEEGQSFLFIKTESRLEKIRFGDVLYITGLGEYRRIHLRNKTLLTLQGLTELLEQLPPRQFCRVHKSYIVSIDKIEAIERDSVRIGTERIPVSLTYKDAFRQTVGLHHFR